MLVNRMRNAALYTLRGMSAAKHKGLKEVLWENVSALMKAKYGRENINRLARDAKIGVGSVQRIKDAEQSTGIELVEKIAKVFHIDAFQLLCANADQEQFRIICEAYNVADDKTRALFSGIAEQILEANRSARADDTRKSDRG